MKTLTILSTLVSLVFTAGCSGNPSASTSSAINQNSVAVLPFRNMTQIADGESLTNSVTESLIRELGDHSVTIAPLDQSSAVAAESDDVRKIGMKLGVTHLLEGSVQASGDRVSVTAQLRRADNADYVWSDRFNGRMKDLTVIQTEIGNRVYEALTTNVENTQRQWKPKDEGSTGSHLQAEIEEALTHAKEARTAVTEYYMDQGEFAADNAGTGLPDDSEITGKYVKSVGISDGIVAIRFEGDSSSGTLVFKPTVGYDLSLGYDSVTWQCSSPDVDPALLPEECK